MIHGLWAQDGNRRIFGGEPAGGGGDDHVGEGYFGGAGDRTGLRPAGFGRRKQRPATAERPARNGRRNLAEKARKQNQSTFRKDERHGQNIPKVLRTRQGIPDPAVGGMAKRLAPCHPSKMERWIRTSLGRDPLEPRPRMVRGRGKESKIPILIGADLGGFSFLP